jgi:hypothetical protein
MSGRILQINLKFKMARTEFETALAPLADELAKVPGLRWKIWLMNEAEKEAGGIYLFEDQASLNTYLDGPLVAPVAENPDISDISMKQFDVLDGVTAITRGPVQ